MTNDDQLLDPKGKVTERGVRVRFSREGGIEELVAEMLRNGLVTRSLPFVNIDYEAGDLVIDVSFNIGSDPHPGLHFGISFDVDIQDIIRKIESSTPTSVELLKKEIEQAGGDPASVEELTEEKAKEVLDALEGSGA